MEEKEEKKKRSRPASEADVLCQYWADGAMTHGRPPSSRALPCVSGSGLLAVLVHVQSILYAFCKLLALLMALMPVQFAAVLCCAVLCCTCTRTLSPEMDAVNALLRPSKYTSDDGL